MEGISVSTIRKEDAVRLWRGIVATYREQGGKESALADAVLMSPGNFSKVSSGQQGDLLGMVLELGKTYPALRRDFLLGLAELEAADPLTLAGERLTQAAIDFLLVQAEIIPKRMAHATLPVQQSARRMA